MNGSARTPAIHTSERGGPSFPEVVRIHLRILVREFPVAWIALAGLGLILLILSLRVWLGADALGEVMLETQITFTALASIVFLFALLWPDAVWRNLPPGGREALDVLPVTRRTHRLGRLLAGAVLPLLTYLAVALVAATLHLTLPALQDASGPWGGGGTGPLFTGLSGWLTVLGGLAATYLIGSFLALRLGRVLLPFLLFWGIATALHFLFMSLGSVVGTEIIRIGLFEGTWSPGRVLVTAMVFDDGATLLSSWAWAVGLLGLVWWEADRRE